MRNKQILLSGRAVVTNAANVPADRYTFLHLSDAEPNLGVANANGWVLVYDTETPGNRLWSKNLITAYDHANSAYGSQNTTGVYANAAFLKANSAYASQNVTGTYANNAYLHSNSAYQSQNTTGVYANAAFLKANSAYDSQNTTGIYANSAFLKANSAYESQNVTGTYANAAYAQANSASLYANGAFVQANSAYDSQNTTGVYANAAFLQSNSAYAQANSASLYANGAFVQANSAYDSQNTTGTYANSAFLKANSAYAQANSASLYANGAFVQANAAYDSQNTTGTYANSAYAQANSASLYANGAFVEANSAYDSQNTTGVYANAAFLQANSAYAQANSASLYANGAFVEANSAYQSQNTTGVYANAAFLKANSAYESQNVTGTYANNAYVRANNSLDANVGGTVTGPVTVQGDFSVLGNVYLTGNTFSISVGSIVSNDSLLILGANNYYNDIVDIGFSSHYNDGVNAHTGLIRDATDKEWYLFKGYTPELSPNNNIVLTDPSFAIDTLHANLKSNNTIVRGIEIGYYANASFLQANTAYASQNVTGTYANNAYAQANSSSLYANGAFIQANAAYDSQNITGVYANSAYQSQNTTGIYANAAYAQANSASLYANGAFIQANASYDSQNVTGTYANNAYAQANSASLYANGAFVQSNSAYDQANSAALYANGAFIQANAAYASQNVTGTYANSAYASQNTTGIYANSAYASQNVTGTYANNAYLHANSAYSSQNVTGTYANAAFLKANSAYESQNVTGTYANNAYLHANSAYDSQNTTGVYANAAYAQANSASLYANGAFIQANASYDSQNVTGTYANNAYLHANSAYESQNVTGTYANSAYASQNVTGTYANNAYLHANAAFTKVNVAVFSVTTNVNELYSNTSTGNIRLGLATVNSNVGEFGSASQVPVLTVDKFGRIVSAYNSTITIPPGTYIYPNVGQLTSNANYGDVLIGLANVNVNIGTFGSQFAVPTITTDGYGRILSISNTTISIPQGTYIVNSDFITANSQTGNVVLGLSESGVIAGTYGGQNYTPVIEVDIYGRITYANNVSTMGSGSGGSVNTLSTVVKTSYTATAGQTAFSAATSFEPGYVDVYVNGLHLSPNDYGANGSLGQITINNLSLFDGDVVDIQTVTTYVVNANTVYQKQTIIATAGQTIITTDYDPGNVNVYLNGLRLLDGTDYTATNGINITFPIALELNDVVEVEKIGKSEIYIANSTIATRNTITVTANGDTTFIVGGGYRAGFTDIYMNGIKLNIPGDVTALDGNTITIVSTTTEVGDFIEINSMGPSYSLANAIPVTGGTVYGGLNVVQNITANSANVATLYFNDGTSMATAASGSGGSGITWKIATANTTANSGEGILVDTTTANVHITLNASPMLGNTVRIVDMTSNFAINNCIIQRNGQKIMGLNENLVISSNNAGIGLVFSNSTHGWRIIENP